MLSNAHLEMSLSVLMLAYDPVPIGERELSVILEVEMPAFPRMYFVLSFLAVKVYLLSRPASSWDWSDRSAQH
jgi:hypothetical protein